MHRLLPLLIVLPMLATAGEITQTKEASAFSYIYTMDQHPSSLDLDGNGAKDWVGDTWLLEVDSGLAKNSQKGSPDGVQLLRADSRIDANPYLFLGLNQQPDASWTLEVKVAKVGGVQGSNGWFGLVSANRSESNSSSLLLMDDRLKFGGQDYLVGSNFASGYFHTIRVAHAAQDNALFCWVDGVLLNKSLGAPIHGVNGKGLTDALFIGDYSQSISGLFAIDSISLTEGAFAPTATEVQTLRRDAEAAGIVHVKKGEGDTLIQIQGINLQLFKD